MVGLDRDRAFYPTVLMVIASYYILLHPFRGDGCFERYTRGGARGSQRLLSARSSGLQAKLMVGSRRDYCPWSFRFRASPVDSKPRSTSLVAWLLPHV